MKFLCDRCKTRYSIGDERVRGKILKIRCKNCANVITVREGMMPDPEAAPESLPRAKKSTTGAPEALLDSAAPPRPVNEPARAAQPADAGRGDKLRPSAQAAESARKDRSPSPARGESPSFDAARERGTGAASARQQTAAAKGQAQATSGARQAADAGRGDRARGGQGLDAKRGEVNALGAAFASAMAKPPPALDEEWYVSIDGEQEGPYSLAEAQQWVGQKPFDAELYCWSEGFDDWLPVDKVSHFRGLRKRPPAPAPPPVPRTIIPPRAAAPAPTPVPVPVPVDDEPKPLFAATMASLERAAPASQALALPSVAKPARATPPFGSPIPPRTNGANAAPIHARADKPVVAKPGGTPVPAGNPFDISETPDSQTQIEPMPPASTTLLGTGPNTATVAAVTAASSDFGSDDDHDLAIGEVSRVVKLGDIVRSGRSADRAAAAERSGVMRRSTPMPTVGRSTGMASSFRSTGAIPAGGAAAFDGADPAAEGDPALTMAPVAKSHRRGLITLLSVAVVLVLGVVGAVVLLVTTNDDPTSSRLGPVRDIDTSRPEDPITHRPIDPTKPPAPNPFVPPRPAPHPRINPNPASGSEGPEAPVGNALRAEEIEDVARKYQDSTQRCYMRSQRGADAILVGDVKKIGVTLTIDGDGSVSEINLSDHGADNLGKCLTGLMRGWKFRPSPGGQFRFSLNFVGG